MFYSLYLCKVFTLLKILVVYKIFFHIFLKKPTPKIKFIND